MLAVCAASQNACLIRDNQKINQNIIWNLNDKKSLVKNLTWSFLQSTNLYFTSMQGVNLKVGILFLSI